MPKISRHGGPSNAVTGEGAPRRKGAPSAAEMLQARGKLGPYPQPEPAEPEVQPEPPAAEPETPVLEQPARNASREAWAEYVEALTGEEVPEDTTRSELIELYGTPS